MTKEKLMEAVEGLPDEFNIDELVERLRFIEAVEEGFKDAEAGNTVSQDEIEALVKLWQPQ